MDDGRGRLKAIAVHSTRTPHPARRDQRPEARDQLTPDTRHLKPNIKRPSEAMK